MTLSINRHMKSGGGDEINDTTTHTNIQSIFRNIECGEIQHPDGTRVPVNGDVSQISRILGLSSQEKALLRNFQFMFANIAGTRQMRRCVGHIIKSFMIIYGCPVFMTITPGERHVWSMLSIPARPSQGPSSVH